MNIVYSIGSFIGYFTIMLALMGIAIATAKYFVSWLFYAAGGILQLLSLIGYSRSIQSVSNSYFAHFIDTSSLNLSLILRWVFYAFILLISLTIILKRRAIYRAEEIIRSQYQASVQPSHHTIQQAEPRFSADIAANVPEWQCTCGRTNADYVMSCSCGVTKAEMKLRNRTEKDEK